MCCFLSKNEKKFLYLLSYQLRPNFSLMIILYLIVKFSVFLLLLVDSVTVLFANYMSTLTKSIIPVLF